MRRAHIHARYHDIRKLYFYPINSYNFCFNPPNWQLDVDVSLVMPFTLKYNTKNKKRKIKICKKQKKKMKTEHLIIG